MSAASVAAAKEKPKTIDDAAAQLKRLLITLPMLADDSAHQVADVAESLGVSEETLARDLRTLVTRFDDGPGGFVEGVRLAFGADTVQLESHLFKRPMGLTADEIGALEVGLAALERELPPHEAAVAAQARERLVAAAAEETLRDGGAGDRVTSQLVGSELEGVLLNELRAAIGAGKKVEIVYRSSGAPAGASRMIRPHGIVFARGRWFLVAFCERNAEVRIFRLDRMTAVSVSAHDARPSDDANITATVLADGLLSGCADEQLRIRYSPRVARWLAETSDALLQVDGSLLLRYPLHDDDWAVRHTLSYGPDAIVEAPDRIQTQLASTARLLAE